MGERKSLGGVFPGERWMLVVPRAPALLSGSGLLLQNRGLASRKTHKDLGFRTQDGKNMDKT